MSIIRLLKVISFGVVLAFHNANAMKEILEVVSAGKSSIKISENKQQATIESERLFMRHIEGEGDLDYYRQIFCNCSAMEKYMEGFPRKEEEVMGRYTKYRTWWLNGNPYSSYLIFLTEGTEKIFIGHILLEPGDDRDLKTDAEVSYVILPAFWRKGYGTEAVENIVELAKHLRCKEFTLGAHAIDTLIATARPDNPGSCGVLEKNGFKFNSEDNTIKFGAERRLYTLEL